jgi:chorismate synthase
MGESHGALVGIVIDGCPAGLSLTPADFSSDIDRRKGGSMLGTTPRKEADLPILATGVFQDKTTGAPLTIFFKNENVRSSDYEKQRSIPRPGHADFVANRKFGGFEDYRGSGHFSGRLTLCLVAAGVVAKKILSEINIAARLTEVGGASTPEAGIQRAIEQKDSVGGIVECVVTGLPIGLGEPFFDSAESLLAHLAFSIPAVKGIEFGSGFAAARMTGTEHNDSLIDASGKTKTNHAGGLVGGLTNGNPLIFRLAIKPTSSTPKEQTSWNWESGEQEHFSIKGRHDLCIALRVPVVAEAIAAMVVADLMLLEQRIPRVIAQ